MPLTVATLNLHGRADRWRERSHLVVTHLLDAAPDLVALQEVQPSMGQGRWLCSQINSRLTGRGAPLYQFVQKRRQHPLHGFVDAVAILSRLPLLSHDAVNLGYQGRVALRANVALPTGHTLDFVSTHFHSGAHARQARLEQMMSLVGWLQETGRAPLQVMAGDFNETPDGPAIGYARQGYHSAYAIVHGRDPLATFPTALVERPDGWAGCLDYIFTSKGLTVHDAHLCCNRHAIGDDTLYASDHVGLFARLEVVD